MCFSYDQEASEKQSARCARKAGFARVVRREMPVFEILQQHSNESYNDLTHASTRSIVKLTEPCF